LEAQAKTKEAKVSSPQPHIWRTIMKSRTTRYAAATIIIAALLAVLHFGGSIDGTSMAWAELVQRVEQSHDEYMKELLSATEEKDTEKVNFYAHPLEQFWQKLGWLARGELDPKFKVQAVAMIADQEARYEQSGQSAQTSIRLFLAYEDQFREWLAGIEDTAWINDTAHVCKQLEEYGEEIRDAARSPELDFSYVEHCMPSFITYCQWFKQLPWDDPRQYMTPAILLSGIQRDLNIARREMETLEIRDVIRFVERCVQQAQKNALDLDEKTASTSTREQRDLCRRLARKIDELSDLITYTTIATWDIEQTGEIRRDQALHQLLAREFASKGFLGAYLLEQIDQSLDMCRQLLAELEPVQ
jgi:hypothetical protein